MKTNYKIIASGLMIALIGFTSCESLFEDVNISPNAATDAPIDNVLMAAMVSSIVAMEGEDARLAGMWSRQFTGTDRQYAAYNIYNVNAEDFEYDKHYYGVCEQAKVVIQKGEDENNLFYAGIGRILQAQSYATVAALYGNVPFSEANQFPDITDPVFDNQADVYAGVQSLLDQAISDLNSGVGSDLAGIDFFFGGSAANWVKAAYSLKARYYLHVGNYASAKAAAANGILDNADNWMAPHSGGYNQGMNLYHSFGQWDRDGYMTVDGSYLHSILDSSDAMYRGDAKTVDTARYQHYFAFNPGIGLMDLNFYGDGVFTETSSFPFFEARETHAIFAECESRDGNDAEALTHLNHIRQINQAMYPAGLYADYDLTDFDGGGMADNGQGSASANLLYEILEEKYCSLIGQIEVFNDVRRTDNLLGLPPTTGSQIPERFLIPQDELNTNDNAPEVSSVFTPTPVNN